MSRNLLYIIGVIAAIFFYGVWRESVGYNKHKDEVTAEYQKKERVWKDELAKQDADADADKVAIAEYYSSYKRVLPSRSKVQPNGSASKDAEQLLRSPEEYISIAEHLRLSKDCAQDVAFILQQQRYGKAIGLEADSK